MWTSLCVSVSEYWEQQQTLTFILFLPSGKIDAFFLGNDEHVAEIVLLQNWVGERKWNANRMEKGEINQCKTLPFKLIQQALLHLYVVYFFPLFSFLSSWSLWFPLSTAFRAVLSSCQGNESEGPLSATTLFLCLTLTFLCLCPLVVHSAPYCLSTLHFDLRRLWCHTGSKGCWEVTQGWMSSCPWAFLPL